MDPSGAGGLLDWSLGQLKVLSPTDWAMVLGAFVLIRASSLLGMWAYALIALPGTLAHELAHFLVALVLAQVLARRKEFGLLAHLGLTRRQILTLVALEGLVATLMGALAGLLLGLAVAVVLVHVVNPQSFHWTMDLMIPWARLLLLCLAVVIAGTLTAWLAARPAAGRDAVLAVKEDW